MVLMTYAVSLAPDKPVHLGNLVKSYPVRYKVTQGFVVSLVDIMTPHKSTVKPFIFVSTKFRHFSKNDYFVSTLIRQFLIFEKKMRR